MSRHGLMIAFASLACAGVAVGHSSPEATPPPADNQQKLCKMVVTAEHGSKPFEMCMTKAEWAAKEAADARDTGRLICRYEEVPGTRLKNRKLCLTAADWEQRRLDDRQALERIQSSTCVPGAGC